MQKSVEEDRDKFLGGSDIPIIMGISPFKTYYQLLKEKVGIEEAEKVENPYVDYGNIMEEKIRNNVNENLQLNYVEDKLIDGDIRCHVDGYDKEDKSILEVKTTSKTYKKVKSYKYYLVQLLFYMMNYKVDNGILAVYKRPKDFNEEFNENLLEIHFIHIEDYQDWIKEIKQAIEKFRRDKKRLEENCLLGEEDFND